MTPVTVGVDGCARGWVAAIRDGGGAIVALFARMADLVDALPGDAVIVVDIPIGHPERIVGRGRIAEQCASRLLRARRASIFPMPSREVVERFGERAVGMEAILIAHRSASDLARRLSDPPTGLAIQGFSILPKVREVDRLLRENAALTSRVFEGHPEVAFAVLEGREMRHSKKSAAGADERKAVLSNSGLPCSLVHDRVGKIAEDDRIDALAMLLVADRIVAGVARCFPDPPARDAYGLPIAIWA